MEGYTKQESAKTRSKTAGPDVAQMTEGRAGAQVDKRGHTAQGHHRHGAHVCASRQDSQVLGHRETAPRHSAQTRPREGDTAVTVSSATY